MSEVQSDNEVSTTTSMRIFFDKMFSKPVFKIVVIGLIGVVVLYYILGLFDTGVSVQSTSDGTITTDLRCMTTLEYSQRLEGRLENLISYMSGVGRVSVMVSLDGTTSYEYMTTNGKVVYDDGSQPVILDEYLPKVSSVTIVVEGLTADSKVNITMAVSALFDLSTDDIYILQG